MSPFVAGGERDHRVEQHVAAGSDVGLRGGLDFVVADAVLAGDEDHPRRGDARDIDRVVAGARGDRLAGIAQGFRRVLHGTHAIGGELYRRRVPDLLERDFEPALGGKRLGLALGLGSHRRQRVGVRVAQVHREVDRAGDDVARVGTHPHDADGRAGIGRIVEREPVDCRDQHRGAHHRVLAALHRRGAGVGFHSGHVDVEPTDALHPLHDADGLLLRFEDRPLLDMGFEEGADLAPAALHLAGIADPLQLLADGLAVDVCAGQPFFQREHAAEDAGGDHRRREARAFLVGPGRNLDRRVGLVAEVVEGADHLEAREHAVDAVELAARRLAVDMAAGHHRRERVVLASPAGEDVAHLVDADGAAGLLAPLDEEIARRLVHVGEREAADAALLRRADLRHLHEARPQAIAIHLEVPHRAAPSLSSTAGCL